MKIDKEKILKPNTAVFIKNEIEFVNIVNFWNKNGIAHNFESVRRGIDVCFSIRNNTVYWGDIKYYQTKMYSIYNFEDIIIKDEKIKFNIEEFEKTKYAVQTETFDEFSNFLVYLEKNSKLLWGIDTSPTDIPVFTYREFKEKTGIFSEGYVLFYGNVDFFKNGINTIKYSDLIFEDVKKEIKVKKEKKQNIELRKIILENIFSCGRMATVKTKDKVFNGRKTAVLIVDDYVFVKLQTGILESIKIEDIVSVSGNGEVINFEKKK